jgi:hypothetical protein
MVSFLLAGIDLFPVLLFSQEETYSFPDKLELEKAIAVFFENTICDSFCTS